MVRRRSQPLVSLLDLTARNAALRRLTAEWHRNVDAPSRGSEVWRRFEFWDVAFNGIER